MIVLDDNTQFTAKEFKDFCKACSIVHNTPHHIIYRQAERFVDTFKQALKKSGRNKSVDNILQFLRVCHVTPNPRANSGLSPTESMFARKIRSGFNKLLTKNNKKQKRKKEMQNPINQEKTFSLKSTEIGKKSG